MAHPKDKPHARIYRDWMDLPSWRTLSPEAVKLLVEMLASYRPHEPNRFQISGRLAADTIKCSRATAAKALEELEDRGWIKVEAFGRITGPRPNRAACYSLTRYPTSDGRPASKAFLRWQPARVQRLKSTPATVQIRPVNGSLQCHGGSNRHLMDSPQPSADSDEFAND